MLSPPFHRRFGAIIYDFLLHAALWMIVSGLFTGVVLRGQVLDPEHIWLLQITLFPLLLLISFSFSSYFWLKNQQTLGMQAWRLKIVTDKGVRLRWQHVAYRFWFTILTLGLGTFWCLFDREKRSLQDIVTPTQIIYVP